MKLYFVALDVNIISLFTDFCRGFIVSLSIPNHEQEDTWKTLISLQKEFQQLIELSS